MTAQSLRGTLAVLATGLLVALVGRPASASLLVEATVTPVGGAFHYEFSITNNGTDDVILVDISAPTGDPLIDPSLVAPVGFLAVYDGGLGIVSLLEDTSLFAPGTTTGGFSFDSASAPSASFATFEAVAVVLADPFFDFISGEIGKTVVEPAPLPEPTTLALVAIGVLYLGIGRRGGGKGAERRV